MAEEETKKRLTFNPWLVRAFILGFLYYPILIGAACIFPELRSFTTENIHRQTKAVKIITLAVGFLPGAIYFAIYLFSVFRSWVPLKKGSPLWQLGFTFAKQTVAIVLGFAAFLPVFWLIILLSFAIPPLRTCLEFIFIGSSPHDI